LCVGFLKENERRNKKLEKVEVPLKRNLHLFELFCFLLSFLSKNQHAKLHERLEPLVAI